MCVCGEGVCVCPYRSFDLGFVIINRTDLGK